MTTAIAAGACSASASVKSIRCAGLAGDPDRVVRPVLPDLGDHVLRVGTAGVGSVMKTLTDRVILADRPGRRHHSTPSIAAMSWASGSSARRGLADHLDRRDAGRRVLLRQGVEEVPVRARSAAAAARRSCAAPVAAPARPAAENQQHTDRPPARAGAGSTGPAGRRSPPRGRRRRAGWSASAARAPWSARRACIIRAPASASNAGTRVSATSSATTTTLTPAAPTARRISRLEQHQAGQADRHGDPGEQHRAAGGAHRRSTSASVRAALVDRVVRVRTACAAPPGSGRRSAGRSRCTGQGPSPSRR